MISPLESHFLAHSGVNNAHVQFRTHWNFHKLSHLLLVACLEVQFQSKVYCITLVARDPNLRWLSYHLLPCLFPSTDPQVPFFGNFSSAPCFGVDPASSWDSELVALKLLFPLARLSLDDGSYAWSLAWCAFNWVVNGLQLGHNQTWLVQNLGATGL